MNELHGTRCGSGTCGMNYREQLRKWESSFVFVLRVVERVFECGSLPLFYFEIIFATSESHSE